MVRAQRYPKANQTAQWYGDAYPGVDMGGVDKLLLHSTEGGGWPSYDGGAKRPTLTYHPKLREWHQHGLIGYSARALQDPTSTAVRENRDRVVQVEIIGTCDPATKERLPSLVYMRDLSSDNLQDIAELFAWLNAEWGTPVELNVTFLRYPLGKHLSGPAFDALVGLCGHQHASGNDHGDPGDINATSITARARSLVKGRLIATGTASGISDSNDDEQGDDGMPKLISYDGGIYLSDGIFRLPVNPQQFDDLVAKYGVHRAETADAFSILVPLEKVLEIQRNSAQAVADLAARLGRVEALLIAQEAEKVDVAPQVD